MYRAAEGKRKENGAPSARKEPPRNACREASYECVSRAYMHSIYIQVTECDFDDGGLLVPAPYEEFDTDKEAENESGH